MLIVGRLLALSAQFVGALLHPLGRLAHAPGARMMVLRIWLSRRRVIRAMRDIREGRACTYRGMTVLEAEARRWGIEQ